MELRSSISIQSPTFRFKAVFHNKDLFGYQESLNFYQFQNGSCGLYVQF
jgi:hypothetical protein